MRFIGLLQAYRAAITYKKPQVILNASEESFFVFQYNIDLSLKFDVKGPNITISERFLPYTQLGQFHVPVPSLSGTLNVNSATCCLFLEIRW